MNSQINCVYLNWIKWTRETKQKRKKAKLNSCKFPWIFFVLKIKIMLSSGFILFWIFNKFLLETFRAFWVFFSFLNWAFPLLTETTVLLEPTWREHKHRGTTEQNCIKFPNFIFHSKGEVNIIYEIHLPLWTGSMCVGGGEQDPAVKCVHHSSPVTTEFRLQPGIQRCTNLLAC